MPQAAVTGLVSIGTTLGVNLSREWRQQLIRHQQNSLQIALLKIQVNFRKKSHKK